MNRSHVAPCAIVVALGLALVLATGVSLASVATFGLVLLCPLVMIGMMWWMGSHAHRAPPGPDR